MKKIVLKCMLVAFTLGLVSCGDSDNAIDDLFDNTQTGAFIRTLEEIRDELDLADTSSSYEILVEEQDEQFGGLFQSLEIFVIFDGDNALTTETLLTTYTPADAGVSDNGLPEITLTSTYAQMLAATGVDSAIVNNNDKMELRLVLNLTDGRSYSVDDVNGNVSGGQYFQAPMEYTIKIKNQ